MISRGKQLAACGIDPLRCGGGSDFGNAREESAKAAKQLTGEIRQVMEKIVIRRNRLDLTSDPDYKGEITTLSDVQDPKQQYVRDPPDIGGRRENLLLPIT